MSALEVFLVKAELNKWAWLHVTSGDEGLYLAGFFNGTSARERWRPVGVETIREDDGSERPLGDIAIFYPGSPALSPRACQALARFLEPAGELLPLRSQDPRLDGWYVFNATTIVDALDEDRSVVHRNAVSGRITVIRRYEFHSERLTAPVFKTPSIGSELYCLRSVVNEVERAGLRGFGFKKVWSATIQ
jgi:hypothetical protein